jgi:hypothetical protein
MNTVGNAVAQTRKYGRPWFIDAPSVAELACLIDALRPEHRAPILRAALGFAPCDGLEASYLVGSYRSLVVDAVCARAGRTVNVVELKAIDCLITDRWLEPFAEASDLARVQLAVCDLLTFLVRNVEDQRGSRQS